MCSSVASEEVAVWESCVVVDLQSTRCRCRAAAQPHSRPRSAGSDTVPPLLSVQPTWPTCRSRTEPQRCNFPSVCGFKSSPGASHRHEHKRHMVAAESWNLKCGLDSPERWTYRQNCFCIFPFFFFFFLNPGFFIKMSELWTNYIFLLAFCSGSGFGIPNKCDEVRKVFQLREIGPNQLLPLSPRPGMLELIFTVCFFFFFFFFFLTHTF